MWVGALGMPYKELFYLELSEVYACFDAYEEKELNAWRRARMVGFWTFKAMGAKKLKSPAGLMKLKGDPKPPKLPRRALIAYLKKWGDI